MLLELKEQAYKLSKGNIMQNLDKDEQELLDSIENDDWVSIPDSKLEIQRFQDIAKRQVLMQKIELKVSLQDCDTIHNLANQLGLSVSDFAENIIHKYLKGELVKKVKFFN
jgi:predicted DNA binding CopG/RHH family protein